MKKEEVLVLCTTEEQKARVEATYVAAGKTNKKSRFEKAKTASEALEMIEELVVQFNKRKTAADNLKIIVSKVETALSLGADYDSIVAAIDSLIADKKEEHNKKVLDQIEALKSKLL